MPIERFKKKENDSIEFEEFELPDLPIIKRLKTPSGVPVRQEEFELPEIEFDRVEAEKPKLGAWARWSRTMDNFWSNTSIGKIMDGTYGIEESAYGPIRFFEAAVERPLLSMSSLLLKGSSEVSERLGLDDLSDHFNRAAELGVSGDFGLISPYVKEEKEKRVVEASEAGLAFSVGNTMAEAGYDLAALMLHMAMLNPKGVATTAAPYVGKVGKLAQYTRHASKLGTYRFVTTPSNDMGERAISAAWMLAYNATPYLATGIIGKLSPSFTRLIPGGNLGMKAFFTDVVLNTALSSPAYKQLGDEYGWFTEEFLSQAIPNLMLDVGMAWSTRNFPLPDQAREITRLSEVAAEKHHKLHGGDLVKIKADYEKMYKDISDMASPDFYKEFGSSTHLSVKYSELTGKTKEISTDANGKLNRESVDLLNSAFSTDIKASKPSEFLEKAIEAGVKFDESSPAFRTAREIAEEQARTPDSRIRQNVDENIQIAYRRLDKIEAKYRDYPGLDGFADSTKLKSLSDGVRAEKDSSQGKLGDYVANEEVRGVLKDVLETPIKVGSVPEGAVAVFRDGEIIIGKGTKLSPADLLDTILEEGIHALRANLGRPFSREDAIKMGVKEYRDLPEEISARAFIDFAREKYLERDDVKPPTREEISQIEKEAKDLVKKLKLPKEKETVKRLIGRMTKLSDKEITVKERDSMRDILRRIEREVDKAVAMEKREARETQRMALRTQRESIETRFRDRIYDYDNARSEISEFLRGFVPKSERGVFVSDLAKAKTTTDIQKVYDRAVEVLERYQKSNATKELRSLVQRANKEKSLSQSARDGIKQITESLDIWNFSEKKIDKAIDALKLHDIMTPETIRVLDMIKEKKVKDLTSSEIFEINDKIRGLIHHSKNLTKDVLAMRRFERRFIEEESLKNLRGGKPLEGEIKSLERPEKAPMLERVKKVFHFQQLGAEDVAKILDGKSRDELRIIKEREIDGKFHKEHIVDEVVYENINAGFRKRHEYFFGARDIVRDGIKSAGLKQNEVMKWSDAFQKDTKDVISTKIDLTKGRSVKLTPDEKMAVYLHSKSPDNVNHLINGGFVYSTKDPKAQTPFKLTLDDIKIIRDSLTPQEKIVADSIHRYFNEFSAPRINETSRDIVGYNIATIRDYFPIHSLKIQVELDALKVSPSDMKSFLKRTVESTGYLKGRIDGKDTIVLDGAMHAAFRHMQDIASYVGLAQPLSTAKNFIENPNIYKEIENGFGKDALGNIKDYIRHIEGETVRMSKVDKYTADFLSNFTVFALGLNPFVAAKQPVSLLMALSEIDGKYLMKGAGSGSEDMARAVKEMKEHSPELRDRSEGNASREMGELGNVGLMAKAFTGREPWNQKFMAGIRYMDMQAIGRIWNAVKAEVSGRYPELKGDDYMRVVARRAEQVVRNTQPTWEMKDRSQIARDSSLQVRLITRFTSQRNKNFRIMSRGIGEYMRSDKTEADVMKLTTKMIVPIVTSAMAIAAINEARNAILGRRDDERDNVEWAKQFAIDTIGTMFGNIYFAGEAFDLTRSQLEKGRYQAWEFTNPLYTYINTGISFTSGLVRTVNHATTGEKYQSGVNAGKEKWAVEAIRTTEDLADIIGMSFGISYKSAYQIAKRLYFLPEEMREKRLKELDDSLDFDLDFDIDFDIDFDLDFDLEFDL